VYLVNTAGTTAGALGASFGLLPAFGVRGSLDLLTGLAAAALALATAGTTWAAPWRLAVIALAALLAAVPALGPAWEMRLMHLSLNRDAGTVLQMWREGSLAEHVADMTVRELRDGVDGTVSVVDFAEGGRSLYVNGKIDASDSKDKVTQALIGHLPLLLHPAPDDVLVVGMGSGMTLGAVAQHPVARIDLVEISRDVLELGDRHFRAINHDALHDPRVASFVEDGRNFIAFNEARRYDVIVNEPSNPWMTGVANLFTDDFFVAVRRRLKPGGILAQWFHYYSMAPEDVRSLVGTLGRHFPHLYGFAFHEAPLAPGDLILLASEAPLDFAPVLAATEGTGPAGADFRDFGLRAPRDALGGLVLSPEGVGRFVDGAPLNSDDRPRIELAAPRALFRSDVGRANLRALLEASASARLYVSAADSPPDGAYRTASFEARTPSGFRRIFSGYRIELAPPAEPAMMPRRQLLRQLTFADGGGRRIEVIGWNAVVDRRGLNGIASLSVGAALTVAGETTVHGHPAALYRRPGTGAEVVAWSCPVTRTSHAIAVVGGSPRISDLIADMHCRHGA
jgi:spermidine synthase